MSDAAPYAWVSSDQRLSSSFSMTRPFHGEALMPTSPTGRSAILGPVRKADKVRPAWIRRGRPLLKARIPLTCFRTDSGDLSKVEVSSQIATSGTMTVSVSEIKLDASQTGTCCPG